MYAGVFFGGGGSRGSGETGVVGLQPRLHRRGDLDFLAGWRKDTGKYFLLFESTFWSLRPEFLSPGWV